MRGDRDMEIEESAEPEYGVLVSGQYQSGYLYRIPLSYVHTGTTFLAVATTGPSRILMTAIMDGQAVSDSYGRILGSEFYVSKENGYLNVQIGGFEAHYASEMRCRSQTIYSKDNWDICVTNEEYGRYRSDVRAEKKALADKVNAKARAEKDDAKERIQDQIKKAEDLLADARKKLALLG